jgi:hypothetical protein
MMILINAQQMRRVRVEGLKSHNEFTQATSAQQHQEEMARHEAQSSHFNDTLNDRRCVREGRISDHGGLQK